MKNLTNNQSCGMIDIDSVIECFNKIDDVSCEKVKKFQSTDFKHKRYLLGRNQHSATLIKIFDINGVIDDFAGDGTMWNDQLVIKSAQIPKDALVVNCSMSISPISAARRLNELSNITMIAYSDLCKALPELLPLPDFVDEARSDIATNKSKYNHIHSLLGDKESKHIFNSLIGYRLTGDYSFMRDCTVRFKEQYFEPFLGALDESVFVDCGGYDGDTTEEFCQKYPNYKDVYIFEPSEENVGKAKIRLNGVRDIQLVPLGLSDEPGVLWFNADAGSASSISENGSCKVDVTTLDDYIKGEISFIKMDIEGWELRALKGSTKHILVDHPILAISVYHHISDFWQIPEFIFNIRDDYDVYLRHYTEGWSETVMYFIPR